MALMWSRRLSKELKRKTPRQRLHKIFTDPKYQTESRMQNLKRSSFTDPTRAKHLNEGDILKKRIKNHRANSNQLKADTIIFSFQTTLTIILIQ